MNVIIVVLADSDVAAFIAFNGGFAQNRDSHLLQSLMAALVSAAASNLIEN